MRRARRVAFPLRVVAARLRRRRLSVLVTAVGIATGAAVLGAVLAGSLIAQDRRVGDAIEAVDPSSRAVRVASFGTPGELTASYAELDRQVRSALRGVTPEEPTALVLYRESTIAGRFVGLGAVDGLARWIRVTSGRLPRECRPERCEVVRLRGEGPLPDAPDLHVVQVGEAVLTSRALFGDFVAPVENRLDEQELSQQYQQEARYHEPPPAPLVLAEGVAGLVSSPRLDPVYRSFAWVVPLESGSVRLWDVDRFTAAVTRARSELELVSGTFEVLAPTTELAQARAQTRAGGRRLVLVGGEAAALLFVFAALAATTMRRDSLAARRRLALHGATRSQLVLATAGEALALGAIATAAGWAIGIGAAAALAAASEEPVGAVLSHSLLSPGGIALGACVAVAAGLVVAAALRVRSFELRGLSVSPLDLVALAAAAVVAVALARGALDEEALAREEGTAWLLLVLPALVTLVVAIVATRLVPLVARGLERSSRRLLALRLAAVTLARNPGHAAIAIAFFVVSLGLALFAAAYHSTLATGQREQAAYAVPLDFTVTEDPSRLIPVADAAPPERFREIDPDGAVTPILRATGSVPRLGTGGVTALGLEPDVIPHLDGLRDDFSTLSPGALARAIDVEGDPTLRGLELPAGATGLALPVEASGVILIASIETPSGQVVNVELGRARGTPGETLRAELPPDAREGRVVAIRVAQPRRTVEPGANAGQAPAKPLRIGPIAAIVGGAERPLAGSYESWIGTDGLEVESAGAEGATLRYRVSYELANRFRPVQPADGLALPVIATPRLAAAAVGGELPVRIGGVDVKVRIAAVADLLPGVEGEFVVADRDWFASVLNTEAPGRPVVNEMWLSAPGAAQERVADALAQPPFNVLRTTSRTEVEAALRDDPLAEGVLVTLLAAAAVALALALAGLLLVLLGALRDERPQFLDLEAQGAGPLLLRRLVRLRAGVVVALGIAGGIAAGAALSALVVRLVSVTAGSTRAVPPLRLDLNWPLVGVAAAGYVAIAVLVVATVTAHAFRRSGTRGRAGAVVADPEGGRS